MSARAFSTVAAVDWPMSDGDDGWFPALHTGEEGEEKATGSQDDQGKAKKIH